VYTLHTTSHFIVHALANHLGFSLTSESSVALLRGVYVSAKFHDSSPQLSSWGDGVDHSLKSDAVDVA